MEQEPATQTLVEKKKQPRKVKEVKEKKPRGYSFISAFSDWRKEHDWKGLCPAKGSKEYDEIRTIYDHHKA